MTDFRDPGVSGLPGLPGLPELDVPTTRVRHGVWTTPVTTVPSAPPSMTESGVARPVAPAAPRVTGSRWLARGRLTIHVAAIATALTMATVATLIFTYRWVAPPASALMLSQQMHGTHVVRQWRSLEQISPHLARAVIMSEDAGFCGHRGVDFTELERAYERGLDGGSRGGASTISMQVTKNLFLWPSRSYLRKAVEIPLTLVEDRWWGKRRMLEIYLNMVEWGPGIFGAEAAARTYFHKPARDLSEGEAALMAVALPNPRLRNPGAPTAQQRRMAGVVQGRMKAGARNVRCLVGVAEDER